MYFILEDTPRKIPGFDNTFLCKYSDMGLNEEHNEAPPARE